MGPMQDVLTLHRYVLKNASFVVLCGYQWRGLVINHPLHRVCVATFGDNLSNTQLTKPCTMCACADLVKPQLGCTVTLQLVNFFLPIPWCTYHTAFVGAGRGNCQLTLKLVAPCDFTMVLGGTTTAKSGLQKQLSSADNKGKVGHVTAV